MEKPVAAGAARSRTAAALRRLTDGVVLPLLRRIAPSAAHRAELALGRSTSFGVGLGLLVYLAIAALFLGRTLVDPTGTFAGRPGDAEQYMWYLGLFWHAVLSGHSPFVTHLMNYPYGINLMWNTSILAEGLLFGPLVALAGSTAAYNVWFLLNILAAGVLGQQLLGRLGMRQSLAITGGALIAMLPYITTQALSHISLITTAPLLSALLILVLVAQGQVRRPALLGALLGLAAAVQFYTLIEVLVSAVLVLALGLAVTSSVDGPRLRQVLRRVPIAFWIAAAATFAILAAPGVYELLVGPYRVFRSVQPPNVYVTDLFNLILPTQAFAMHIPYVDPANWFTGNFAEDNGYLGVPAILLILWSVKRLWHRPLARILTWTAAGVTTLSLGSTVHVLGFTTPIPMPWWLFAHVPFIKDLLPARLMLYADLAIVALMLLAIEDWLRDARGTGRSPIIWLAIVILTWLPVIPYTNTALPAATPAFAPGTAVANALKGQPTYVLTSAFPEIMQALQRTGYAFPVANVYGHNDNGPTRQQDLEGAAGLINPHLTPDVYQSIVQKDLKQLRVRRVVFVPRPSYGLRTLPKDALQALDGAFGPPVAASSGVLVWRIPAAPAP